MQTRAPSQFIALATTIVFSFFCRTVRADALLTPVFTPVQASMSVDSGWVSATGNSFEPVFTSEVRVPGAAWLRLRFEETVLGGDEGSGSGAFLRLTSLEDGAVQTLHATHLFQWNNRSAYFNGEAVQVELLATALSGPCRVRVIEATYEPMPAMPGGTSEEDDASPRSYCGTDDNRDLSDDGRVARIILDSGTVGTVFMIDDPNHTFLTNGSIAANINDDAVIEFHAPLTYPNGTTLNHPSPEFQYVADLTSVQFATGAAGTGNNWGYFGANANSTSGLTPFETEGVYFELADGIPPVDDRGIRTYGNGFTQPPVFRTWSFVQKTEVGEYIGFTGTRVQFRNDLTSGDAGAAVIDDTTGEVIGVASEDGCTAIGGSNAATAITNPNLRTALNHPLGVCVALVYNFPNGQPDQLNPNGGTAIRVEVTGANGSEPEPGSGQLHYNANNGMGWITIPMVVVGPGLYDAVFPAFSCGAFVDYYVSAETTMGIRVPDQLANPTSTFRAVAATTINVISNWDFESGTGWTVDGVVINGAWERGVPVRNTTTGNPPPPGAPATDFDGSGQCWVTENSLVDGDVDGGPTRLRSPSFNLSATSNAYVSYAQWFTNEPVDIDTMIVQMSNNGGLAYSTAETISNHAGWVVSRYRVDSILPVSSSVRFRFHVIDNPNNSRTEAAIDAFSIIDYQCDTSTCMKGDVNDDDVINASDIGPFTTVLLGGSAPGTQPFCATDMDGDGVLETTDDIASFTNCLVNGTCP